MRQHLGLEYETEDRVAELESQLGSAVTERTLEALGALPAELLAAMWGATLNGHLVRLLELIDEVAATDSHLAEDLRGLAEGYSYEQLIEVLTLGDEVP